MNDPVFTTIMIIIVVMVVIGFQVLYQVYELIP